MRPHTFYLLLVLAAVHCIPCAAQQYVLPPGFDSTGHDITVNWKFKAGDDTTWAAPGFDDSSWDTLGSNFLINNPTAEKFKGIGWFRLRIVTDTAHSGKIFAMEMNQEGASEIWLDGKRVHEWGKVSADAQKEERFNPHQIPFTFTFPRSGEHVLAVRYSNTDVADPKYANTPAGFTMRVDTANDSIINRVIENTALSFMFSFISCFFLTIGLVHLLMFLFYREQRANLSFSLFTIGMAVWFFSVFMRLNHVDPSVTSVFDSIIFFFLPAIFIFLLAVVYRQFYQRKLKFFWVAVGANLLSLVLIFLSLSEISFLIIVLSLIATLVEIMRVVIVAMIRRKEGAIILGTGMMFFVLFVIIIVAMAMIYQNIHLGGDIISLLIILAILAIPVSMSIYLARSFALMNKNLKLQLVQVQVLSEKNLQQEQEKKRMLEAQNEQLELQVAERTAQVVHQKREIEEKNKSITDSITYAKRIQQAMLPHEEELAKMLPHAFVLYLPKDIVSGDFYWIVRKGEHTYVAGADCTGHGVPGAFMSMIGNALLNEIVNEKNVSDPASILGHLHTGIRQMLKQDQQHGETRDGMDIALCRISFETGEVQFAGAMRPVYIVRPGSASPEEIKPDKYPIGGIQGSEQRKFTTHTLHLHKGDMLYISSDGYADQFGGSKGKKFMVKNLHRLFMEIHSLPVQEQKQKLHDVFEEWRGSLEQVDDVLVIGIRMQDYLR